MQTIEATAPYLKLVVKRQVLQETVEPVAPVEGVEAGWMGAAGDQRDQETSPGLRQRALGRCYFALFSRHLIEKGVI